MTNLCFFVICCFTFVLQSTPLWGDLIWLKGTQKPIAGLLKNREDNGNVVWLASSDSNEELSAMVINSDMVEKIVVTINTNRLAKLSLTQLQAYRDYAEELIAAGSDPYARQTAKRLLLICVYHGFENNDDRIVSSAIKNLLHVAQNEDEKTAYRRLQRLYTKEPDSDVVSSRQPESLKPNNKSRILTMLQSLRKSEFAKAADSLDALTPAGDLLPQKLADSIKSAINKKSLDVRLRQEIIKWESYIRFDLDLQNKPMPYNSDRLTAPNSGNLKSTHVEDLTDIDLLATQYSDFCWKRPQNSESR